MQKFEIIEEDSNYVATIIKLPPLEPVTGLDNLMLARVFGYGCLVGKDSDPDVPYVFFPAECELSPEYLYNNNLYRHQELNVDKAKKGFFEDNGRVRAVKFKGVVSSGFIIPVDSLGTLKKHVEEGDSFHNIAWVQICKKYRSPASLRAERLAAAQWLKKPKHDRVIPNQFRLHVSTPQFLRFLEDFKEGDRIVITEKLHWTSAVFSNVLTKRKLGLMDKLAKLLRLPISENEYFPLYSSRTVIKNSHINPNQDGGFYGEDVWGEWAKKLEGKIEKGITLYGEIVGYTEGGKAIQKGYSYGCVAGTSEFYVYRATMTTPDGNVIEFTDDQIRQYCGLRSIKVVPRVDTCIWYNEDEFLNENDLWDIEVMCNFNDKKVPREWVVIRRDGKETFSAYKLKSQMFLTYETKLLDAGEEIES